MIDSSANEFWDESGQWVWGLVCHLPDGLRQNRRLLMLKAYVDECGFDGRGPAYVFGGWVGTAQTWAKFSTEWQQFLDMKPKIDYFRMSEAMSLSGQFSHWREAARDEKIRDLRNIIGRYSDQIFGVTCSILIDDYSRVASDARAKTLLKSPYYYLFFSIICEWLEAQHRFGLFPEESIDFIFDEQVIEQNKIFDAWQEFKSSPMLPRRLRKLISPATPIFGDDKCFRPLQAADIHAWICLQRWKEKIHGLEPVIIPGSSTDTGVLNCIGFEWDEAALRGNIEDIERSYTVTIRSKLIFMHGSWVA